VASKKLSVTDVTSSSSAQITTTSTTTAMNDLRIEVAGWDAAAKAQKAVETAVYGYVRSLRALKRTAVTATEIAQALGLSQTEVEQALAALQQKGIKPLS
jgi:hypothetical protein